jgi:hypothetical protein
LFRLAGSSKEDEERPASCYIIRIKLEYLLGRLSC